MYEKLFFTSIGFLFLVASAVVGANYVENQKQQDILLNHAGLLRETVVILMQINKNDEDQERRLRELERKVGGIYLQKENKSSNF